MAVKQLEVKDVGMVYFQKRRGTGSVRIHIQGHSVRVTLPNWVSYGEAVKFVYSRKEWIHEHITQRPTLATGALIGKQHQLTIESADINKPKTRVTDREVKVLIPRNSDVESVENQDTILKACERALLKESKELLTSRIHDLSYEFGLDFNTLHFKKLKRRWGSCDANKNLVFNIFLIQLPWKYIDYVIFHELTHTKHMHHGSEFWQALTDLVPDAKSLRKEMHQFHPQLLPQ